MVYMCRFNFFYFSNLLNVKMGIIFIPMCMFISLFFLIDMILV